ncbi:MAG: NADH-quinone oxidoreductase subunit NuoE [candidate division Zixibacteria bacterium]|nr:NADH-quinone oxidoreductase subunit NuoE [candidate division Zixibacteria bacterium]MDD5425072.1 NADH-quinone oxidoreductase subunit NuoE [candidate division Zixibacteria bacterium]
MKQDFTTIPSIIARHPRKASSLIMILQDIQKEFNYLPEEAMRKTAETLEVPMSKVYSVATFYNAFSLVPRGEKLIRVCVGTACHIRGSKVIREQFENELKIKPGETTPDMKYSLEVVGCVGACAMAPVVMINDKYFGSVKTSRIKQLVGKG